MKHRLWTKGETAYLLNNWRHQEQAVIAVKLGRTQEAIKRKILKLGLRKTTGDQNKKDIHSIKIYDRKPLPYRKSKEAAIFYGKPMKMSDLKPGDCRWPVGEGKQMMFCGAPRDGKHVYCTEHHKCSKRK